MYMMSLYDIFVNNFHAKACYSPFSQYIIKDPKIKGVKNNLLKGKRCIVL